MYNFFSEYDIIFGMELFKYFLIFRDVLVKIMNLKSDDNYKKYFLYCFNFVGFLYN